MVKPKGNTTASLTAAKKAKNDEFYTQLPDIERELKHYKKHLKGKVVLCNCDDPRVSNFFRYFYCGFRDLGIKKLISVCYKNLNPDLFSQNKDERAVYCVYDGQRRENDVISDGDYNAFLRKNTWQTLRGDGDFRSKECIELLKQADIVVTNPPFSLFREFVAQLDEYKKDFVIIGNVNAITYKEIFKLIKENKIWLGESISSGDREFGVPDDYPLTAAGYRVDERGQKYIRVKGVRWFTNLDTPKRHEMLTLYKKYKPEEYPKYDSFDAIDVSKVVEIPIDYDGYMGVPITFLDKYNPEQFEILGVTNHGNMLGIPYANNNCFAEVNGQRRYVRILIKNKTT